MAPFVPFLAENVYQNLVRGVDSNAPLSVHMTAWPIADRALEDAQLLFEFDVVQKVVGLARAARGQSGVRTRQPLARLLIRAPDDAAQAALAEHHEQILEEMNVKSIEFIARDAGLVNYRIKPNLPRLGKRHGKLIPQIRTALEAADGAVIAGAVARGDGFEIDLVECRLALTVEDVLIETSSAEGFACAEDGGYLTALDTRLDAALIREGIARELVRTVQDARKQAGLNVSDRIILGVSGTPGVEAALAEYRDFLMAETLASGWQTEQNDALFDDQRRLDEEEWRIVLRKSGADG
jgi:isoleucyl-tRNA synthetase